MDKSRCVNGIAGHALVLGGYPPTCFTRFPDSDG